MNLPASFTIDIEELKSLYDAAFSNESTELPDIMEIDNTQLSQKEQCSLLNEEIIGSTQSQITEFINSLGNSDWIKEGIKYKEKSGSRCPFCTQTISDDLAAEIVAYFDTSYEKKCSELTEFLEQYREYTKMLISEYAKIVDDRYEFLDFSLYETTLESLRLLAANNILIIEHKCELPSKIVNVESLQQLLNKLNSHIKNFIGLTRKHNKIVKFKSKSRKECKEKVWKLIANELKDVITKYLNEEDGYEKASAQLQGKIGDLKGKIDQLNHKIEEKEKTITSIAPTVNKIRDLLKAYGFDGFTIRDNSKFARGTYQVVRINGNPVEKTLSEGEHNFLAFLYFYCLVFGSHSEVGLGDEKIIVIDDPVSSMDSGVMFIVKMLVREIIRKCKQDQDNIRQIFILTHNIYFHKEITFKKGYENWSSDVYAFWLIRKIENISRIEYAGVKNPIETSYCLLWKEIRFASRGVSYQPITIYNTMRRILEYYFRIIGTMDYESKIMEIQGIDQPLCHGLLSALNDESHTIEDDIDLQTDVHSSSNLLRAFELIFRHFGHVEHYNMMMSIEDAE